ncbi:hypothetical protein D9758_016697 [Tetrapyrgos nigripes]|uniref:Uncharacterized protein n=1 Tax=Tetrapyrgos nigripes TaxID=182062 RepID=A0A8H5C681_9AGAR|nr:hypothetical protein D9758_016697 [Tetrapyrgos nigripes]
MRRGSRPSAVPRPRRTAPTSNHSRTNASVARAYRDLQNTPVPLRIDPQTHPSQELEQALLHLKALTDHIDDLRYQPTARHAALEQYSNNWLTAVWPWLSALLRLCVLEVESEPTTQEAIQYQHQLLHLFCTLAMMPPTQDDQGRQKSWTLSLLEQSPELFALEIDVWTYAMDRYHLSLSSLFILVDQSIDASAESDDKSLLPRNAATIFRSPRTTQLLISHLRNRKNPPYDNTYVRTDLSCAIKIIVDTVDASAEALPILLASDLLGCLSLVLRVLTKQSRLQAYTEDVEGKELEARATSFRETVVIMRQILRLFHRAMEEYGAMAVTAILRGQLIRSMINSFVVISLDEGEPIDEFPTPTVWFRRLLETVPTFFWCREVLNTSLHSLMKVRYEDNKVWLAFGEVVVKPSPYPDIHQLGQVYGAFVRAVGRIKDLRNEFEDQGVVVCASLNVCAVHHIYTNIQLLMISCSVHYEGLTPIPESAACGARGAKSQTIAPGIVKRETGRMDIASTASIIVCSTHGFTTDGPYQVKSELCGLA